MKVKKIISAFHLWIGMSAGFILSIVGLTGAIYVFSPEIEAYAYNKQVCASMTKQECSPLDVIKIYEKRYGERIVTFLNQRRADHFFILYLKNPERKIIINPYTGKEIGNQPNQRSFWDWVIQIHTNLTMGKTGKYIIGSSSLLLAVVLLSTGIFLWWPKNKAALKKRFRIKWSGTFKRKIYDVHQVGGFYIHFVIGMLAITGACSTFQKLAPTVINWFTFTDSKTTMEPTSSRLPVKNQQLSYTEIVKLSEKIIPEFHLRHIYYNQDRQDHSPVILTKTNFKWISSGKYIRAYFYIDRYSGKVLFEDDPRRNPIGEKIQDYYKRQIHYGEIGGWTTRALAFFGGLSIPVLYVTGILVWYNRKWGKKQRRQAGY